MINMGLNPSSHDPFLLSGVLSNPSSPETISTVQYQLHVCLYFKDFVFYSSDPTQEALFKTLLQEHIQVDLMGDVYCFLGTAFTWLKQKDGNIPVHLCQSAFTEFTAHQFLFQNANKVPNMTPYHSGLPVDSIPPVDPLDPDLPRLIQVYQIIFGCINWLATCAHLYFVPALTFLASYRNSTHPQHYKAAVHDSKYLISTNEYGISFRSQSLSTIQAFNHFPYHRDKEAYTEGTSPSPS